MLEPAGGLQEPNVLIPPTGELQADRAPIGHKARVERRGGLLREVVRRRVRDVVQGKSGIVGRRGKLGGECRCGCNGGRPTS